MPARFPLEVLHTALDTSGVGVWEMRLPSRQLVWSDRCRALFGLRGEDITFEQMMAAVHPQDRSLVYDTLAQAADAAGDGRYECEFRVVHPGYHGQTHWLRLVGSADFDSARTAAERVYGFCSDVTERHQATATASQRLQDFEFLTDNIPDALWITRADGGLTYVNSRWTEYTGQTLEQALEWGWSAVIHPDDLGECLARWNRSVQAGRPYDVEYRLKSNTGEYRWFLARGRALRDADGYITKWFGVCTDIHEQRELQQQLAAREAQFRSISNSIPQLAWMTASSGYILWYNQRWYDYTGTTLEQMRGWGWQQVHHPEHVERVLARWSRSLETGEPWQDVFPLRSRSGEYRWFLSQAVPIHDADGHILHWFGTNTDITELRQLPPEPPAPEL